MNHRIFNYSVNNTRDEKETRRQMRKQKSSDNLGDNNTSQLTTTAKN